MHKTSNIITKSLSAIGKVFKNLFFMSRGAAVLFFGSAKKSFLLMSKSERVAASVLTLAAVVMFGFRLNQYYIDNTIIVPAKGGQYDELVIGSVKYLNPLLTQTDADRAISSLIFTGLIRVENGEPVSDLAKSWSVETDGKRYIFEIRPDVFFHDGSPVTASDVALTVETIKTPSYKSVYYNSWKDVGVEVLGEKTIAFVLPKSYGPFIYNCSFGVLPAHLSSEEFSKKYIGTGPYAFDKSLLDQGKIKEVWLKNAAASYRPALIEKMHFVISESADKYLNQINSGDFEAVSNTGGGNNLADYSYDSSRRLGLILNTRKDILKDKEVRRKILSNEVTENQLELKLITSESELQRSKAGEIIAELEQKNYKINVEYLPAVKMQDALFAKEYDLLLYGFDFGYDRDPYIFWHSSQLLSSNLSGWSDKKTDIMLEDARMIIDKTAREAKYDEIFQLIASESLAKFYEPISYQFFLDTRITNLAKITGSQPESRYERIEEWYLKEKRVKKEEAVGR